MKQLIIFLTILFLSTNLFGQETGILYLYKTSSGLVWKTIGDDKLQAKYIGAIKNGEPEGIGNLTSPDGDKFEGVWKNGKNMGKGLTVYLQEQIMKGNGRMGKNMGKENLSGPMVTSMLENGMLD